MVSPHTDDAELSCGGSISRWVREGREVLIAYLSDTRNVFGDNHGITLRAEARNAAEKMGLKQESIVFYDFPTRSFFDVRQEILDALIQIAHDFDPDLVVGPDPEDTHQDHNATANELPRAFRRSSIFGFDTYWNMSHQKPEAVVELQLEDFERKLDAIRCYLSQAHRPYMDKDALMAQARFRALPRGFALAESFSIRQLICARED